MANSKDSNDNQWVDDRLKTLETPGDFWPDGARARERLRQRSGMTGGAVRQRWVLGTTAAMLVGLLALPGSRAAAQRLWKQLTLSHVEVVQVDRKDVPDDIAAVFAMQPEPWNEESVASAEEAARKVGFRPLLPLSSVVNGQPRLAVVASVVLSTKTLRIAEIEQALAVAGVTDVTVPREWEGTTLVAHGGPAVIAQYQDLELIQSAPFRMTTPAAFEFGRFMELAFRVFGREAGEARALGQRFAANPALVMHFPERGPVRDVPLRSGHGVYVGDPNGSDGICFFWNTKDHIFILSADTISEQQAAAVANSIE
jgi:hypothetical protein